MLSGWGRAGVISSILPTCPGVAIKLSSAGFLAAIVMDWCAHLDIVMVGGAS